jgi:hypothetical protein
VSHCHESSELRFKPGLPSVTHVSEVGNFRQGRFFCWQCIRSAISNRLLTQRHRDKHHRFYHIRRDRNCRTVRHSSTSRRETGGSDDKSIYRRHVSGRLHAPNNGRKCWLPCGHPDTVNWRYRGTMPARQRPVDAWFDEATGPYGKSPYENATFWYTATPSYKLSGAQTLLLSRVLDMMSLKIVGGLLIAVLSATIARDTIETKLSFFSWNFGETVQYTLDNIVALDDVWSPEHLPQDKSHLDHTFAGQSPPVYPSR